jgi:hypothetical protein
MRRFVLVLGLLIAGSASAQAQPQRPLGPLGSLGRLLRPYDGRAMSLRCLSAPPRRLPLFTFPEKSF